MKEPRERTNHKVDFCPPSIYFKRAQTGGERSSGFKVMGKHDGNLVHFQGSGRHTTPPALCPSRENCSMTDVKRC